MSNDLDLEPDDYALRMQGRIAELEAEIRELRIQAIYDFGQYQEAVEKMPSLPTWQPIETAPQGRKSVLLIAPYPGERDWSDPRVGWHDGLSWVRWPHTFQPTHWAPIPALPDMAG